MGRLNYDSAPVRNIPTAAPGDSSSMPASTAFVQNAVPAGVVLPYAGPVPPAGWLLCDGSNVSRTAYAKLFASIGTTYGTGDGTTTFRLPDLRGEFVRGLDQGRGVDTGRTIGTLQSDSMRVPYNIGRVGANAFLAGTQAGLDYLAANKGLDGINAGTETRPRNVAMNYIIKFA
ncbi:tail fiber protein [Geminicoccus flavidas]|uniref:tail fiber protein n=1 Tax=Geminicoccus flavidas TaxID=2506407 RepID=UPI00135C9397|nr:tail fiber protein [Geminicoccus flavidas]